LAEESWNRIKEARAVVNRLTDSEDPYFGVNTGVGIFSNRKLDKNDIADF
jgi:histidine ammonia-lyase